MAPEADPLPKLRAKLDELETHVKRRLAPAANPNPQAPPWTTPARTRDTSQRPPIPPLGNAPPGNQEEHPESFLSRVARFFGAGR